MPITGVYYIQKESGRDRNWHKQDDLTVKPHVKKQDYLKTFIVLKIFPAEETALPFVKTLKA